MRSEKRKLEIIKVAAYLFKEKGYSAVTMRDIAQELGIKAASLYNHIKSKQEILTQIIMSIAEEFTQGMRIITQIDSTSIDKLEQIIQLHVQVTTNNPNGMAALNADWMHLEEELERYWSLRNSYEESFREILLKGIENNELAPVDPEVILFSILSTLRSLYLWIPKKTDVNSKELSSQLSKVLLEGIIK